MEKYLALVKNTTGRACANLISDMLSSDDVFLFGEIISEKNIIALASFTEYSTYPALLQLFAYGTLAQYNPAIHPELNAKQSAKLKLLTLLDLASKCPTSSLPYSTIAAACDLQTPESLTELLIKALDLKLIDGKLDVKHQVFWVKSCVGRDCADSDGLLRVLEGWLANNEAVIEGIRENVARVGAEEAKVVKEKEKFEALLAVCLASEFL